ncbi:MAG: FAD-dependent oxidoreductase [Cyclobacteriaceae bacterium]
MRRRKFVQMGALSPLLGMPIAYAERKKIFVKNGVEEKARVLEVAGEYDVIVSGAGPAGVCAAIEAGRNGAKTLLVEVNGCLGGVWTAGLLTWILDQSNKPGLMREIERSLLEKEGVCKDIDTGGVLSFDAEIMKVLLDDMCMDAGVDVLFHTRVVSSVKDENKRLTHIVTESKSGRQAWKGSVFLDTTGDGDLAALSGCGFDFGREGDQALQPFSLLGLLTGVNYDEIKPYSRSAEDSKAGSPSKKRLLGEIVQGGFNPSYLKPGLYPIRKDMFMIMANHEYGFSPLNVIEVSKATIQARKEVNNIVDALRSNGGIWGNVRLVATGEQIGTREGRRIHGLYTVTKEDLVKGARFEDAVCRVTFGVDVHSVSHSDEKSSASGPKKSYNQGIKSKDYDIPMRALIAKDVGGLMMAGRCISGDFISHSSYRVTGNAVAMGEAVGQVGAISSKKNILPQEVDFAKVKRY